MSEGTRRNRTICMVDDDETEFVFLEKAFADINTDVRLIKVTDPESAFAVVAENQPDLVLLDLKMPGLSGHEVLQELKQNGRTAHIPVLIFSTSESMEDFEQSYRHHANAYIVKPNGRDGYRFLARSLEDFWFKIASVAV